jgi:hypothetical protein
MSRWMEYLFQDQVYPADAKGVEVVLQVLDPNGNFYEIGRTTSDINGNFGLQFTPEVPGNYQILAKFAGSASYGSSSASTYMGVSDVTPTTAPVDNTQPDMVTNGNLITYLAVGVIAIIIAIVLVGLLILRKRP